MDLSIQKISNEKAITYKIVDLIESYSFHIFFPEQCPYEKTKLNYKMAIFYCDEFIDRGNRK